MALVDNLIEKFPYLDKSQLLANKITNVIYYADISELNKIIIDHLVEMDNVWILFDNIDKGFPFNVTHPSAGDLLYCGGKSKVINCNMSRGFQDLWTPKTSLA